MITHSKLYYGDGNVSIDYNDDIARVEIHYTGKVEIIKKLNSNWVLFVNDKKIIVRSKKKENPKIDLLFTYEGFLTVNKCMVTDINDNRIISARINNNLSYWYKMGTKWEDGGIWNNYTQTLQVGKKVNKTRMVASDGEIKAIVGLPTPQLGTRLVDNTYSVDFDGSNDYVDLGDLDVVTDIFTISGWAKPTDASDFQVIMSKYDDNATYKANRVFRIILSGSVCYCVIKKASGNDFATSTTTTTQSDGQWFHFAFTDDGSNLKGYINGVLEDTDSTSAGSLNASNEDFLIGAQHDNTSVSHHFEGNIDEVGIWSSALTSIEVKVLYDNVRLDLKQNTAGYESQSSLVGWWRMGDGDTFPTILDNSNNSNNGTMTNMDSGDIESDVP